MLLHGTLVTVVYGDVDLTAALKILKFSSFENMRSFETVENMIEINSKSLIFF